MSEKERFNWSKWGFWLAIILFIITALMWAFQTYWFEKSSKLSYEIISNEEVLTITENIKNLEVQYNGIDLRKSDSNLSILTFRVINRGEKGILKSHYDNKFPIGLTISKGELVTMPEIISSSDNNYFNDVFKKAGEDTILFEQKIIDQNQYFDIKCLLKNKNGIKPEINPIGKVAGVNKIEVKEFTDEKEENTSKSIPRLIMTLIFGFLLSYFAGRIKIEKHHNL